jgi:hypothetical protein
VPATEPGVWDAPPAPKRTTRREARLMRTDEEEFNHIIVTVMTVGDLRAH